MAISEIEKRKISRHIKDVCPQTEANSYSIESPRDQAYNCVGYALNNNQKHIDSGMEAYWPFPRIPRSKNIDSYARIFEAQGYGRLEELDFTHQIGIEKVLLYARANKEFAHAARQDRSTGLWLSKIGTSGDITHADPYAIASNFYGAPALVLVRTIAE